MFLNSMTIILITIFDGICDDFNILRMSIWSIGNNKCKCLRGRRFPFNNLINFFNNFLIKVTDYKLNIYLNNNLIGKARKFYDSPFFPNLPNIPPGCYQRAYSSIPSESFLCDQVLNMKNCNISLFGNCIDYVKIYKDIMFPMPSQNPMQIRFSNWLYDKVVDGGINKNQKLFEEWDNIIQVNKEIIIDNIIVYHRVNCFDNFQVSNLTQFKINSYGSNFLSGSKITIGYGFFNSEENFPLHVLATNEIEFVENVAITEFLRADIINCNFSGGISQKNSNAIFHDYELIYPIIPINGFGAEEKDVLFDSTSTDNKAIKIFPNPTGKIFFIDINEEDLNYLYKIELLDIFGKAYNLEISTTQDIEKFNEGIYMVKFYFTNGIIVTKPLIIKR